VLRLELDEFHERRCGTVAVGQFGQPEPVAAMLRVPVGEQTVAHRELQVTCRLVRAEGLGLPRITPLERHRHVVPAGRSLVVGGDHHGRGDDYGSDLYYGTMALAQAEMLASPSGPTDLDEVEDMTKFGHGLYALPTPEGGFADLQVGVLARGFFPKWMESLEHDTSGYPQKRPRSAAALERVPTDMACSLRDLFASTTREA